MEKEIVYRYMGSNGIIESSIQLTGIPVTTLYRLIADYNKKLTRDGKEFFSISPLVPEDELEEWYEV